jgi:hypothetical protein
VAQATRDAASTWVGGGGGPLLYADNVAIVGGGVLLRLWGRHLGLFLQAGTALDLIRGGQGAVLDVRGGAFLGLETSRCWPAPEAGAVLGLIPCADLYAELDYVSRFAHDVVAYGRGRAGATWLLTGPVAWQLVGEGRAAFDRNGDYYNNFAEAGLGPRWRLLRPFRLDLFASVNAGSYLGRAGRDPLPERLSYFDFRFQAATYVEF